MPNEGKRQFAMSQEEREAKIVLWSGYSEVVLKRIRLQSEEAAAFLGVSDRTMQDERGAAKAAVDAGLPVDPEGIRSIPCSGTGTILYTAFHLLEYLDRTTFVVGGGRRMPDSLKGPGSRPKKKGPLEQAADQLALNASRIVAWMQTADSASTWPFSIQPDGRPIDLHTAMVEDKLTGKAERLNLQEFSEQLSKAAAVATALREQNDIDVDTPHPVDAETQTTDRWTKPGGPI